MPSDFRLYPTDLSNSESGNSAGSANPLEGRILALERQVRQGAIQTRTSLRNALVASGIPDLRNRLQSLQVVDGGSPSPSPSPSPTGELAAVITAVKSRLPAAQYSGSRLAAIESFVTTLWNAGVWQKLYRFYCFVAPNSTAAFTDWIGGNNFTSNGETQLFPWRHIQISNSGSLSSGQIPASYSPLNSSFYLKATATPDYSSYTTDFHNLISHDHPLGVMRTQTPGYGEALRLFFYVPQFAQSSNSMFSIDYFGTNSQVLDLKGFGVGVANKLDFVFNRSSQTNGFLSSGSNVGLPITNLSELSEDQLASRASFDVHGVMTMPFYHKATALGKALTKEQSELLINSTDTLCAALENDGSGDVSAAISAIKSRLPINQYSQSKIAAIEAFVTALWNGGVWQKLHRFHCFVSPTSVAALVDWVGGVNLTPLGSHITLTPWQSINLYFTFGYVFGALTSPEGSTMPGYSPLNSSMFFKGKAGGLIDEYALNEDNYLNDRDYGLVGVPDGAYPVDKVRLFYRKTSSTSAIYLIDTVWSQGSTVEEESKALEIGSTQSGAIAFVSNRSGQSTGLVVSGSSSQSLTFQPLTESMLAMPRSQFFVGPVPGFSGISYQCVAIGQSLTQQQSALLISASNTLCTAMEG